MRSGWCLRLRHDHKPTKLFEKPADEGGEGALSSSEQWRWTDDEGVQRLLREEELRAALADGRLKPGTLVWRRGMSSWKPADEVPELMDLDEDDGPETITKQQPLTLGKRMAPTPSIPPTPGNMIDIASLHAQQGRPLVPTLMGVGEGKDKAKAGPKPNVRIPVAPKLPAIDGGWKEGAARRDDDEQTVTKVRMEDEPSTLSDRRPEAVTAKKQRTKSYSAGAKSKPPPKKRGRQTQPTGSLPAIDEVRRAAQRRGLRTGPAGGRRTLPGGARSSTDRKKRASTVPPPVKSSAVLSEAFESPKAEPKRPAPAPGGTLVSADGKQQDALVAAAKRAKLPPPQKSVAPPVPKRSAPPVPKRSVPPTRAAAPSAPLPLGDSVSLKGKTTDVMNDEAKVGARDRRPALPTGPLPEVRDPRADDSGPIFAKAPWEKANEAEADKPKDAKDDKDEKGLPLVGIAQQPQGSLTGSVVGAPIVEPPGGMARVKDSFTRNTALAAAGIALALVVASFLLGRLSSPAEAGMAAAVARTGFVTVPLFARARARPEPPRPCLMKRAPGRFAPAAHKSIPIELAQSSGRLAVGYAESMTEPRGMLIDLETGESEQVHAPEAAEDSDLSRAVPVVQGGEVGFATSLAEDDPVRAAVHVAAASPFVIGFTGSHMVKFAERGAEPIDLWALDPPNKSADALRASVVGDNGVAVAYRYDGQVYYGALEVGGGVIHPAGVIAGSGGKVGKPSVANNGHEVSVVFADKPPAADARIELRWARGKFGEPLRDAVVVELPQGGPGGDAIAPAIAALPNHRWLLMWTEGRRPGPYTLRAQTYDRKYRPIGEALRVSPGTGSFGQGSVGVVGEDAAVLFLLATSQGYEIWGTVLQCR